MSNDHRGYRLILTVVAGGSLLGVRAPRACGDRPPCGERPLVGPATSEEIAALIRDLGDPSYETRTYATRRLCVLGMAAFDPLRAAADAPDPEVALRAKKVLTVLETLWFSGSELALSFSKPTTAWNESVDLTLTITNRSAYPARIPFEINSAARADPAGDARQVADMLDLAEWLHVRQPDGRELTLRVDDITADPNVAAAVQERLQGGPVGVLRAGERVAITARDFNRGWARFPVLDRGDYTVVLEYLPDWDDEALAAARVGRVVSGAASVTVTRGAPQTISRTGAEAELTLERDGPALVARLTNQSDLAAYVNVNFGPTPPFATARWVYESDGLRREIPASVEAAPSWKDFSESRWVALEAGRSMTLARTNVVDLRKALTEAGADLTRPGWTLHFSYANLCDRAWQARQGAALFADEKVPPFLRHPLPRRTLSTRQTSDRLTAPGE